jgi:hypothetical protein
MKAKLPLLLVALILLAVVPGVSYGDELRGHTDIAGQAGDEPAAAAADQAGDSAEAEIEDSQDTVVKNPTFAEVRDFILEDKTSRNKFVLNQYECRHFATDVNNNAEAAEIRCAFVLLCYRVGQHAVVAFETTDRGLVYIEPQTDAAIHPEVGGKYQNQEIIEILVCW